MKHDLKKIMKIVDEVTTYCMYHYKASRADISIERAAAHYAMRFRFSDLTLPDKALDKLREGLADDRNPELEDYYWQLAGEVENSNELALVALMTDEAEISSQGNNLEITLVRNL